MKKNILFMCGIALGAFLFGPRAHAQAQQTETTVNYIETYGYAEGEFAPDKITIRILLNEAEAKRKPLDELQKKMTDALTKMGIDVEKNLKVIAMQASLKQYLLFKDDVMQKREFELIVTDFATATKVFEVLDWIGVSSAKITSWELQDYDKALLELRLQAIKNGKAQAQAMAEAAGSGLGETLLIQDERRYDRNQFARAKEVSFTRSEDEVVTAMGVVREPELNFGPIKLNATVQLRFKLEKAK